ncbi:urease accessory protein UreF [Paracoccus sediminis]|uniref:Urease accessory protein UreF n=1 Tax=Paracoccus sediminis TaxID=1214787 RepID=A0A238VLX4_9RHOB|nr:urease accessory UreF family protein [Paracoccus sediminis]TBN52270.1 urease accessory protein UreF [Paracoccus sediminis]SNR35117.1 urease accessory protein [Paracoccus sediminis]
MPRRATAIPTPPNTTTPEAARLHLAQILSPAFPVGGFAWSQGLEWAMDAGLVTRATLAPWLAGWLDHGAGWADAVLVALSLRATDHAALDDLARAACLSSQRLAETVEQGTAFAANIAALTGRDQPPAALPVAFGRACAALPLPHPEIIAAFLQAQAAVQIGAAVRFMPLGPVEGQRMLAALHPAILAAAARAAQATQDDLAGTAWGADIAAMRHETMPVRIFRS